MTGIEILQFGVAAGFFILIVIAAIKMTKNPVHK